MPRAAYREFNAYAEVIVSFMWGLEQLGHTVTYAINQADAEARNIVFGGQMTPVAAQGDLRADTIFYNLEQMRGTTSANTRKEVVAYAQRFTVWEYSPFNLPAWSTFTMRRPPILVPVGYAPVLSRIARPETQDIDVLFYGAVNEGRLAAFQALARRELRTAFLTHIYGRTRDEMIARSNLIANVRGSRAAIFEVVRVSYLMANRKAVLAPIEPETEIEADIRSGVIACDPPDFAAKAQALAADDAARAEAEDRGLSVILKRDIRQILQQALEAS